jgi:hypothetical protein
MPALDAEPPSLPSPVGAGAASWLQADGAIVTVPRVRMIVSATNLKRAVAVVLDINA